MLLDVQLPDITGFEVVRRVHGAPDPPAVVLISSRSASDYGRRIARSGAQGFISKADLSAPALRAVLQGTAGRPGAGGGWRRSPSWAPSGCWPMSGSAPITTSERTTSSTRWAA
jgi:DNA-binding NarL/FixJ family response regulator